MNVEESEKESEDSNPQCNQCQEIALSQTKKEKYKRLKRKILALLKGTEGNLGIPAGFFEKKRRKRKSSNTEPEGRRCRHQI